MPRKLRIYVLALLAAGMLAVASGPAGMLAVAKSDAAVMPPEAGGWPTSASASACTTARVGQGYGWYWIIGGKYVDSVCKRPYGGEPYDHAYGVKHYPGWHTTFHAPIITG